MRISSGFVCWQGAGLSLAAARKGRCSPGGHQALSFGADMWSQGLGLGEPGAGRAPRAGARVYPDTGFGRAVSQQLHLWLRGMCKAAEGLGALLAEEPVGFLP